MLGPEIAEAYLTQVTHEFRGSLNAIAGWAEFLRRGPCTDELRVRAAETIARHVQLQSWMIDEFMDTYRFAAGAMRLDRAAFNMVHVVEAAIEAVQPLARSRQVRLDLRNHLPTPGRTYGDAKRLAQAMTALLVNAIHFAPADSDVRVSLDLTPGTIQLTVHDAGLGVASGALPYLFDRTRPRDPARASIRGDFRLGLSFVRDVMTRHGGTIDAELRAPDSGMTFRITMPVQPSDATGVPAVRSADNAAESRELPQLQGVRVLLVDDEPDAREALADLLRKCGAVVHAIGTASDAIAALQAEPVDVLLADIGMPGADGLDLIRYVRALGSGRASRVPAVAVTGRTSEADRRTALAAGYQVHVPKPVDPSTLIAAVAELGYPPASSR